MPKGLLPLGLGRFVTADASISSVIFFLFFILLKFSYFFSFFLFQLFKFVCWLGRCLPSASRDGEKL